uniref:Src kinase-associated phosphoprotein 1 n=1 Tax=Amphilophus citrinellus TaxID=61819 RepID=A0A3Q0RZ38_AMPCI
MGTSLDDFTRLLYDCELFVADILQDENLSGSAEQTREVLLNNFRVVHSRNPETFPLCKDDEGSDDNRSPSLGRSAQSDDASVVSDYQDDGVAEYDEDILPVAAQDLNNILKQGYLEKKRKDHSFFGPEWQKRWCVLNNSIFYYFGSEKDKQQKGSFYINDYTVQMVSNLRKDSKKSACFELSAPGKRPFQFTASSPQEAREWVDQINFVLRGKPASLLFTFSDLLHVSHYGKPLPALFSSSLSTQDKYILLLIDKSHIAWSSEYSNYYQGLWDCQGDESDELTFQRGDLIYIISKEYNIHGWWVGELNGTVGIVPKDFLQPAYIL